MTFINEIGEVLKSTRELSGVSIDEATKDLNIPKMSLIQIEEGNIGSFKDIFELKKYLSDYAKYLGLNPTEVIDEFNEYMFEKTSKLPMEEIEKQAKEDQKEEKEELKIASPYTRLAPIHNNKQFIITIIIVIILVAFAIIWSVNQINAGNIMPRYY